MDYPELAHLRYAIRTTIHEANVMKDKLDSIIISLGVLQKQLERADE